jgi:threonine dehydratase
MKLVVEPGGANGLAVLLNNRAHFAARGPVLVVLSGGNVDADMFARAIARAPD